MKLVIDIGSNTIKCLLGENCGGSVLELFAKSLESRISNGGELVSNAADLIINAIRYFIGESMKLSPKFSVIAVATSALRDAKNKDEILAKVYTATKVKIKILSERDEAELSYFGAMCDTSLPRKNNNAFFDLGGGSMEVVFGVGVEALFSRSFPIGAVKMTKKFLGNGVDNESLSKIADFAKRAFEKSINTEKKFDILVGVGGAVVAARLMKQKMSLGGAENIISLQEMRTMSETVKSLSAQELSAHFGISLNRAEILPAAFVCIIALMEFLGAETIHHTFFNIRCALILK